MQGGGVASGATTFNWQSQAGGNLADGANWDQGGAIPGSANDDTIRIQSNQSAPITLSQDITLVSGTANYLGFNGEMKFDTAETTLSMKQSYWRASSRVWSFTRGILNLGAFYFENGNDNAISGNTLTISGSEATLKGGVTMASTSPNNTMIITNGAKAVLTGFCVGRNADNYGKDKDLVSSNNLFRVTGAGTTASVSGVVSTGVRANNRVEVLDGATADFLEVKLGISSYDSSDTTVTHVFDPGGTLLVSGAGTKLTVNPNGTYNKSNAKRLVVGWSTGSNTLEVVNGAELVCLSNYVDVGNSLYKSDQKTGNEYKALGTIDITNRVPTYRFPGNVLRVKGAGSKFVFRGTASSGVRVAWNNGCTDDNRIEVLDGASWDSDGGDFAVYGASSNGVYVGKGATFTHGGYAIHIGNQTESTDAFFTVDGGACTSTVDFAIGPAGARSRLEVLNGGRLVADGAGFLIGGKRDTTEERAAVFSISGASSSASAKTLALYSDSTLAFDVPETGFDATPLKVQTVTFGTLCAKRPTLRVTASAKNRARYVTLVEAENAIALPDGLTLDLPEGASLVKEGSSRYDAKKITVKLPTALGFMIIVR